MARRRRPPSSPPTPAVDDEAARRWRAAVRAIGGAERSDLDGTHALDDAAIARWRALGEPAAAFLAATALAPYAVVEDDGDESALPTDRDAARRRAARAVALLSAAFEEHAASTLLAVVQAARAAGDDDVARAALQGLQVVGAPELFDLAPIVLRGAPAGGSDAPDEDDEPLAPSGEGAAVLDRPPTIDALFDELEVADDYDDTVFTALDALGPAVVEPALARLPRADDDAASSLLELIGRHGRGDPRAYDALVAALDRLPAMAASALADLGDARALGALSTALDGAAADEAVIEIAASIEALGGALTEAQRARRAAAFAARRKAFGR